MKSILKRVVTVTSVLLFLVSGTSEVRAQALGNTIYINSDVDSTGCQLIFSVSYWVTNSNGTEISSSGQIPAESSLHLRMDWHSAGVISGSGYNCAPTDTHGNGYSADYATNLPGPFYSNYTNEGQNIVVAIPSEGNQPDGSYVVGVAADGSYFLTDQGNNDAGGGSGSGEGSIRLLIAPPTSNVTINSCSQGGSWSLSPAPVSGNGTNSMVVAPSNSGTSYTLNYTAPSGYHIGSISPASSQLMYPNGTYSYVANCTVDQPATVPPPTNPSGSCSANGTTGTFSWTAPAGYTTFHTGAVDTDAGTTLGAPAADDNFVGVSKSFTTTAGHSYTWYVQTKNTGNGTYSDAVGGAFTCGYPACPANQTRNATTHVCEVNACTNPDQTRDSGGTCACPSPKVPNSDNTACVYSDCPANQTRDAGGVCQWNACPTNQTRDADGVCQWNACAITGQTRDSGGTCSCPSGQQVNAAGTACETPLVCPADAATHPSCLPGQTVGSDTITTHYSGADCHTTSQTEVNTCSFPICPASSTQNLGCPAGYSGLDTKTTSYPTSDCVAHVEEVNTCSPNACGPGYNTNYGCPGGYIGTHTQTTTYVNPPTCSASLAQHNSCTPGPIPIAVSTNVPTTWSITPGPFNGKDNNSVYPTPPVNGDLYTLVAQVPAGYDFPTYTNSKMGSGNPDNSMFLVAGDFTGAFSVQFTPSFAYTLSNGGMSPSPVVKGGSGHTSVGSITITKTLTSGNTKPVYLTVSPDIQGVSYDMPGGGGCAPNLTCTTTINFTVASSAPVGSRTITVTGSESPVQTTTFSLQIDKSPDITVSSCSGSPNPAVLGQQAVTWNASGISGGTGTGYTYLWTGSGIPASPAPTTIPYTVTYTTIGQKVATLHVTDSNGNTGICTPSAVQVNFNPNSKEI